MSDALVARALHRAAVYRLLAGAFVSPTAARLEELARVAATCAETAEGALRAALARFGAAAGATEASTAADEHAFLFGRQVRCSPYESAYSGLSPFGDKTARLADVAGFYDAFGFGAAAAQPELEDHIGAELEFMSALALKEAYARDAGEAEGLEVTEAAARVFLTEHLGRWGEALAAAVAEATPVPFYTAAAELLAVWIATEVETLGAAPVRVTAPDPPDPEQTEPLACPMVRDAPAE